MRLGLPVPVSRALSRRAILPLRRGAPARKSVTVAGATALPADVNQCPGAPVRRTCALHGRGEGVECAASGKQAAAGMAHLLTITMNPSIDISTTVDRVIPSRKMRCGPSRRDPGGGGINVARVANRLGADVTALYTAGGERGHLLRRLLGQERIKGISVPIADDTREDFTVEETTTGNEYRFVSTGPELTEIEWRECLEAIATFREPVDYVVASGSLPPGPGRFLRPGGAGRARPPDADSARRLGRGAAGRARGARGSAEAVAAGDARTHRRGARRPRRVHSRLPDPGRRRQGEGRRADAGEPGRDSRPAPTKPGAHGRSRSRR